MRGWWLLQNCFWVSFLLATFTTTTFAQENFYNNNNEDGDDTYLLEKVINELIAQKREFDEQQLYQPDLDEDGSDEGEWVVKVIGGLENAIKIANETNTRLQRQVRGFNDIYVFERIYEAGSRQKRSKGELASHLTHLSDVQWAEHQREKRRTKRQPMMMTSPSMEYLSMFNDPLWPQQWQLHNFNTSKKGDMRIIEAWGLGVTGKGVIVSILDDGIDHQHPDLAPNYDPQSSYDLNDNDNDPMPTRNEDNKHGTRCAGEVSMVANNGICGVGVAFNAKIAGVRMLDGRITDRLEGEALSMGLETVDIYSASWGPNDDGKTVEGPGRLALLGLIKGIKYGRNGKGSIYVWASGNGGMNKDDCNCDGYTSSIFSFSVASAAEDGTFPWYAESCPSTITTTYSSGARGQRMIATVDTNNRCTTSHSGTSASAPIAAGIIALALEANPSLTWRDVQHLGVWTSNPAPLLRANEGWHMNGMGLIMNSKFGFGLMDAYEFVRQAKSWQNVPQQRSCATFFPGFAKRSFASQANTALTFTTDGCAGLPNEINFMEHIQLIADINHNNRGRLQIWLTSPSGTKTRLLKPRINDNSNGGFSSWPFSSLHTWGENPRGQWRLEVDDIGQMNSPSSGVVNNITLIIYGTKEKPIHYNQNRNYTNIDFQKLETPNPPNPTTLLPQQFTNTWLSPSAVNKRSAEILNEYETNPKFRDLVKRNSDVYNTVLNELYDNQAIRQRRKRYYYNQKEFYSR